MSHPLLEARGIDKSFPGVRALSGVDLSLGRGEVLALVGENGAGKSTLVKILAGAQRADAGTLSMAGLPLTLRNVHEALDAGIALIHQELMLAGSLDVASNVFLGREPTKRGLVDRHAIRRGAVAHLHELGLDISPSTRVDDLALGQRQLIEITKALSVNARVLIMDEPTSSLSPHEAEKLFEVISALRERGVSILYISHRLGEVEALADRVMVLRDGVMVGELTGAEIEHDAMVRLMIGRDVSQLYQRASSAPGDPVLEVRSVRSAAHPEHDVSFDVRAGEIVGIAGLVGAGRTELLESLFGITAISGGSVRVAGHEIAAANPRAAIDAGMALVPEDRQHHGLVLDQSVGDNLALTTLASSARRGIRDRAAERHAAGSLIERLSIRTRDAGQQARTLSGGNQQKVVVGKWLAVRPRILLLDEPTRGVDVGAKAEIYALLEELAADGMGILFVSSELEEILGLADRVLVMREGQVTGELERAAMSEASIMALAASPATTLTAASGAGA